MSAQNKVDGYRALLALNSPNPERVIALTTKSRDAKSLHRAARLLRTVRAARARRMPCVRQATRIVSRARATHRSPARATQRCTASSDDPASPSSPALALRMGVSK